MHQYLYDSLVVVEQQIERSMGKRFVETTK
jgi:hypothetical protein